MIVLTSANSRSHGAIHVRGSLGPDETRAFWEAAALDADSAAGLPGFAPRPEYRPLTKFENRGLRLGHGVWDLVFIKR